MARVERPRGQREKFQIEISPVIVEVETEKVVSGPRWVGVWCNGEIGCVGGPRLLHHLIKQSLNESQLLREDYVEILDKGKVRIRVRMTYQELMTYLSFFPSHCVKRVNKLERIMG